MATASLRGLKSHPSLVGSSKIGDNNFKYDYLCATTVEILGVERDLVVKVRAEQPNLLGLDVMYAMDMKLYFVDNKFEISELQPPSDFAFLDFEKLLKSRKLNHADLVDVQLLSPVEESFQGLLSAGHANFVVDLGTTFTLLGRKQGVGVLDLGTSY